MDFLEKIEAIKKKLREIGREDLADQLLDRQLSGGTGGEVLALVCARLLKFEIEESESFKSVKEETSELVEYAHSICLYPKPY